MRITGYDDYYDDYETSLISGNPFESMSTGPSQTFGTVALILALIISLVAYFGFVKSGKTYAQKFVNWLKEFLNFKRIFIENLLMSFIFGTSGNSSFISFKIFLVFS